MLKRGIDVITCGPEPLRPLEMLLSERFIDIMSRVNEQYDIIIIDTPQFLPSMMLRWLPEQPEQR